MQTAKRAFLLFIYSLSGLLCLLSAQPDELQKLIKETIKDKAAQVGVAVIRNGQDTITVNNDIQYPMMSVFKLHQALGVAQYLNDNRQMLDTLLYIEKEDLKPDTYSPLRDHYPEGGISLPIRKLLQYTLQLSDNNACDILFKQTGTPMQLDQYLRSLGLSQFSISQTEDDMHRDLSNCYLNWTTPLEAARLIEILLTRPPFSDTYQKFIIQTLIECQTGKDRLAAPLQHTQAIIGHKTGTGDQNEKGQFIGINDIGFVFLPDGSRYSIAVFVKNSEESDTETAHIIAEVSQAVYNYFTFLSNIKSSSPSPKEKPQI